MKPIYSYTDHLLFLKDRHRSIKKNHPYLSYRYVTKKLGHKSTVVYTRILKGETRITDSYIQTFIDIFKLNEKEAEYFTLLVKQNQSKSIADKIINVNMIIHFLQDNPELFTHAQHQTFINKYYLPIKKSLSIKSLLGYNGYYDNKLKDYLIEFSDVIKIKKESTSYKKVVPNSKAKVLRKYYMTNLELAENAIVNDKDNELNLSYFTVKASKKKYKEIEEELIKCLENIIKTSNTNGKNGKEYLINFQSFPIQKYTISQKRCLKKSRLVNNLRVATVKVKGKY